MNIRRYNTLEQINQEAARRFIAAAQQAIATKGKFTVALTGGSSPVNLYQLLATELFSKQVDWSKCFVFWGDERWVPFEDDRSNARMAFETLLDHVPVPKEQIFMMWAADKSPEEYAAEYESRIREVVGKDGVFDLILLGMGDDGHTASLFPHTEVLKENEKWVVAYYLEPQQMYRITLTAPLINKAASIIFLVNGEKKATALKEVLEGDQNIEQFPTQLINASSGKVTWLVDHAAASKLSKLS